MALSARNVVKLSFVLTPEGLELAIQNSKRHVESVVEETSDTLDLLNSPNLSFRWESSPQDWAFWHNIYQPIKSSSESGVFSHGR